MNTLFDKIWDAHVVTTVEDGPTQLYIDRLYCHEVTSPQAFAGLRERGIGVLRPEKVFCMPDHNTPTHDQDKPIEDPVSKTQVDTLTQNAKDFGLTHYGMMHPKNGIIHVVGPERGLTTAGMTIVRRRRRILPLTVLWEQSLSVSERVRWNGAGITMHSPVSAENNAYHCGR